MYRVGEVARLARITVRTLHHYDRIGLLKPTGRSQGGYRLYAAADLLRLQQIHIGRSLGMSLELIRRTLDDPGFDRRRALVAQRGELVARLDDTHAMIASIDAALRALDRKDAPDMDPKKLFDGFDPSQFDAEVKERWGTTASYRESARRTSAYTEDDWATIEGEEQAILFEFAAVRAAGDPPGGVRARTLAERHRVHIDRWFYPCPATMHAGLAEMYLTDPRFRAHFDQHGEGLAVYVAGAIQANAMASSDPEGPPIG